MNGTDQPAFGLDGQSLLLIGALLVLITIVLTRAALVWLARLRGALGRNRGLGAERDARALLTRAGYRIVTHGLKGEAHVIIDGRRVAIPVTADYLVERRGARSVVEVKSGRRRLATIDTTRRQLLEYTLVFGVETVLLVDADLGEIHEIAFRYDPDSGH